MSLRAKELGVASIVANGQIRDIQVHKDLGIPVFARTIGTTAATGRTCRLPAVDVPVRLHSDYQEASISPGDFIVADVNGVIRLPAELAEQALDTLPVIAKTDKKRAEGIKQGRSVYDVFREYRRK